MNSKNSTIFEEVARPLKRVKDYRKLFGDQEFVYVLEIARKLDMFSGTPFRQGPGGYIFETLLKWVK